MDYKIAFAISAIINIILLVFRTGINASVSDSIKRRRDRKEQEQRSLKLVKSILERISRNINTVNMMIDDLSAFTHEDEFRQILDRYESAKIELDKELVNCSDKIVSEVKRFIDVSQDMTAKVTSREAKNGFMGNTFLKLYISKTDSTLNEVMEVIDKNLRR